MKNTLSVGSAPKQSGSFTQKLFPDKKVFAKRWLGLWLLLLFVGMSWQASATQYYARTTGTWTPGTANTTIFAITSCSTAAASANPGAADNIEVCAGVTLTIANNSTTGTITNLTVDATGILSIGTGSTLTLSGVFTNNGTVQGVSTSTGVLSFTTTTTNSLPGGTGVLNTAAATAVSIKTSVPLTVTAATTIKNLTISSGGSITINNGITLTTQGATFTNSVPSTNVIQSGAGGAGTLLIAVANTTIGMGVDNAYSSANPVNLTISASSTMNFTNTIANLSVATSTVLTITTAKTLTVNGTFSNSGTISSSASAGAFLTLLASGTFAAGTFGTTTAAVNLTVGPPSAGSTIVTVAASTTFASLVVNSGCILTINSGTVTLGDATTAGGGLTCNGVINGVGALTLTGAAASLSYSGNGSVICSGAITLTSSSPIRVFAGGSSLTFANFTCANNSKITVGDGSTTTSVTVNGNFVCTSGVNGLLTISAHATLGIGGNVTFVNGNAANPITNNGIFNVTGTITYDGAQTITNNGTATLSSDVIPSSGTSTWLQGANATLNAGGAMLTATNGVLTATASGNTVNYNGTGNQTLNNTNYYHLTISGARTSNSVTANGAIGVAGNFTASATFTSGGCTMSGSTITFNGSATQTVNTASPFAFAGITLNNSGTVPLNLVTLASNITVNGLLTFTLGNINTSTNSKNVILSSTATVSGASNATGWVNGNVQNVIPASATTNNVVFPIGTSLIYAPATLTNITTGTGTMTITSYTVTGTPPDENNPVANSSYINQSAKCGNYWVLTQSGGSLTNYDIKLDFTNTANTGTPANYVLRKFSSSWGGTNGLPTGNTIATAGSNLTSFGNGEFEVGQPVGSSAIITSAASVCIGNITISGNVSATGNWTLTLSNGSIATGTGNGTFSIPVTTTTVGATYYIASLVDTNGSTNIINLSGLVTVISSFNYGSVVSGDQNFGISCFASSLIPASMSVNGATSGAIYQWYSQAGLATCPSGTSTAGWNSIGAANGANTSTYSPSGAISGSTTYACLITSDPTCGPPTWASGCRHDTITNSASSASVSPDSAVCSGNFTWSATVPNGADYNWYDAATGGNLLGTQDASYSPPTNPLTATTSYWVQPSFTYSLTGGGGLAANTSCSSGTPATNTGNVFNVISAFTLNSVNLYYSSTGNSITITLLNSSNGTVTGLGGVSNPYTFTTSISPTTVTLNWNIPAGNGYQLVFTTTSQPVCFQTGTFNYPLTMNSVTYGNITGGINNGTSNTNVYFYNWLISNIGTCLGPRVQVTATVNTSPNNITASAGANGTISPLGVTSVSCFGSQTYTITPNICYLINNVLVDGVSQGPITSYTFSNVVASHTISASFVINGSSTNQIISSAGSNGSISPNDTITVNCGDTSVFTITPAACYHVLDVQVDGNSVGPVTSYTFNLVTANHTIAATFATNVTASCNGTPVTCNGGSNGTVAISASNGNTPYTYQWSNGGTDASLSGLPAGTYSVTVTDNIGCQGYCSFIVTQPNALNVACSGINGCNGANNGSAAVAASNGTPPYLYLWSDGETTSSINNLSPGTYGVTVTDNCTVSVSCSYTVVNPSSLSASPSSNSPVCQGTSLNLQANAAGGSGALTYSWSGPNSFASSSQNPTIPSVTPAVAGTYTVIVTDANGCTTMATTTVAINLYPIPSVTASGSTTFCHLDSITLTASGGVSYLWSTGETTSSIIVKVSGSFAVSVTADANGCASNGYSAATIVTVNTNPEAVITGDSAYCQGGSSVLSAASSQPGTSSATITGYQWYEGGVPINGANGVTYTATTPGDYTVIVTDSNGCVSTTCP